MGDGQAQTSPASAKCEQHLPAQLHKGLHGGNAPGQGRGLGVDSAGDNQCCALAESKQLHAGGWQLCVEEMCQLASAMGFFLA